MAVYCDTNFLFRLFADMPGSAQAERLLEQLKPTAGPIPIVWLHQLELPNALQLMVLLSRAGRSLRMPPENALPGLTRFDEELAAGLRFRLHALPMDLHVQQARDLSVRHTARHGFRAYDVAHVAAALQLNATSFWSFDAKATRLAALEGLRVL